MDGKGKNIGDGSASSPILIDSRAAGSMLGIGARTLWGLTNCNAIPSRKIGRSVRYSTDELREWVRRGCPTEPGSGDAIRKAVG